MVRFSFNPVVTIRRYRTYLKDFGQQYRSGISGARRLSGEAIWIVLGQVAAIAGALVSVRLLTELLDPGSYGKLALAMTVASLVGQVLLGPLSNGATRFYAPAAEKGDIGGYLGGVRVLLVRCFCIISMVTLCTLVALSFGGRAGLIGITVAAAAYAMLSGASGILSGMQNAARQRPVVALHQGAEPWVRTLIAAALLMTLGSASTTAMWSYALASLLVVVSQYTFFSKSVVNRRVTGSVQDWQQQLLRYSWPFGAWGIFTWLQLASDRWALEHFSSTEEVGLYVVLYQLGYYPISVATGMAVQLLAPLLFKHAGDANDERRNQDVSRTTLSLAVLALGLTGIAAMIAYVFQKEIFGLFVAARFASVMGLLPLVVLSGGLFAAGQVFALQQMTLFKTESMVTAKVVTALLGTGLNVVGAYWNGAVGVVIAGLTFSLCYLSWMAFLCHRGGRSKIVAKTIA